MLRVPPDDGDPVVRHEEYVFRFERASVVVVAVPADDTITVALGEATLPIVHDLSGTHPWSTLLGCGVLWSWRLTNQRNYTDGCQIEFGRPGSIWAVQPMCLASSLTALSLGPIDRLWNQSASSG